MPKTRLRPTWFGKISPPNLSTSNYHSEGPVLLAWALLSSEESPLGWTP
jgi:hypothetical protein